MMVKRRTNGKGFACEKGLTSQETVELNGPCLSLRRSVSNSNTNKIMLVMACVGSRRMHEAIYLIGVGGARTCASLSFHPRVSEFSESTQLSPEVSAGLVCSNLIQ